MASPFVIQIFDKAFKKLGNLANPISLSFTARFNREGTAEIEVASNDSMIGFLLTPGCRVRVGYKGEHLMSGPVLNPSGLFGPGGSVVFQVEDDYRLLGNTLGWVVPNSYTGYHTSGQLAPAGLDDAAQAWIIDYLGDGLATGGPHYHFPDGSAGDGGIRVETAESAIKDLISVNMVYRMGRPVTVADDLERGGNARDAGMLPEVRFAPLDEALEDLLDWSGLGLKFWHDGNSPTIRCDVFTPVEHPLKLTIESGIITSGTWSKQNPTSTRTVVGGPGQDVSRAFWGVNDTTGVEALYGDIVETFRDATGATLDWPDTLAEAYRVAKYYLLRPEVDATAKALFTAYLNEAGGKGLREGAATSGLSLTLSETAQFFYGPGGFHLGDRIRASSRQVDFIDRIQEVEFTYNTTTGLTVTPRVGKRTDDPDALFADAITRLAAAQRRISTSK